MTNEHGRSKVSTSYLGMRAYRFTDEAGDRVVFYRHPSGYKIKHERRDWDARSSGPGGRDSFAGPKVYWAVYDRRKKWVDSFATLREAKAWADGQHHAD